MKMIDLILMAPAQEGAEGGGFMQTALFIGSIFLVLYFFMIRPQSKKQREQRKFMDSVQKGDKIVTIGGMHGRVSKLNEDDTLLMEVDANTKIKIEKSSISLELSKKELKDKKDTQKK